MKKTLVALAVAAFATSASAVTVYEQDGSKVSFDGSIRLRLDKESTKKDGVTTKRGHTNLHNNGSRFGVKFSHNISDDFYGIGRVEFRFNGPSIETDKDDPDQLVVNNTTDKFGSLYAYRAYVGLGSKQFGDLTFGRQVTIGGDDIAQAGFDNAYGTFDGTLTTEGKAVVRYDYKGIEGLHFGVDYRFAEERVNNESTVDSLKNGYGVGAVYTAKLDANQSVTVAAGYTRDNFKTTSSTKHHKDAFQFGAKYVVDALTLALDYSNSVDKKGSDKKIFNGFRVGAKYQVTPAIAAYTNYGYGVDKRKIADRTTKKTKFHRFMLGSEYSLHKNLFTYVEGGLTKSKELNNKKSTDKNIAIGLNVSW